MNKQTLLYIPTLLAALAILCSCRSSKTTALPEPALTPQPQVVEPIPVAVPSAEAKRQADLEAKRQADLEAKRQAELEAKRQADLEAKRQADLAAKRQAELEAKRQADLAAKRQAELEAKRQAELEAKRQAELEAKRQAELEAKRQADLEAKRQADLEAKRQAELEAKRQAELEAKRQAELEAKRQAELEAKRQAELEAKRQAELAAKRQEAARLAAQQQAAAKVVTGSISGTVRIVDDGKELSPENVMLALEPKNTALAPSRPPKQYVVNTESKSFSPRYLTVRVGDTVTYTNGDPFQHNVFSLTPGNKFDLGTYDSGKRPSYTFKNSGFVKVYCNIHSQMASFVMAATSDWTAVIDKDGTFSFADVPPGDYELRAWSVRGSATVPVTITRNGSATAEVVVDASSYKFERHTNKDGKRYKRRIRGEEY